MGIMKMAEQALSEVDTISAEDGGRTRCVTPDACAVKAIGAQSEEVRVIVFTCRLASCVLGTRTRLLLITDAGCDGSIDENVTSTWYADTDGDGYGDDDTLTYGCDPGSGYTETDGDREHHADHPHLIRENTVLPASDIN